MLSVLIPLYNCDATKLVAELADQCTKAGIRFQILCFDDGSKQKYKLINRVVSSVFGVSYLEFEENIGRSKIRNKLGFNAMFENLLFLDCDSSIPSKKFIKRYVRNLEDYSVVYGGTRYKKSPPRSVKKRLHWKYGLTREALPVKKRSARGNMAFRSNNFMIKRELFLSTGFDESITQYGHEDTLLAMRLQTMQIDIRHIDNPVEHKGLEDTKVFLRKTKESIDNLIHLESMGKSIPTPLTKMAGRLKAYHLSPIFHLFYERYASIIEKNLYSKAPKMLYFSLYKLKYYLEQSKI